MKASVCVLGLALALLLPAGFTGPQASDFPRAELERKLHLIRDGEPFRSFQIALGIQPEGHKEREGDFRTPEGRYRLDARNPNSEYFLSIHVSYPNTADQRAAARLGVDPACANMIHGLPNEPTRSETYYRTRDWTNGCIAVSNSDMIDIWLMTDDNTPIEIRP